jgi:hypothetical protein
LSFRRFFFSRLQALFFDPRNARFRTIGVLLADSFGRRSAFRIFTNGIAMRRLTGNMKNIVS